MSFCQRGKSISSRQVEEALASRPRLQPASTTCLFSTSSLSIVTDALFIILLSSSRDVYHSEKEGMTVAKANVGQRQTKDEHQQDPSLASNEEAWQCIKLLYLYQWCPYNAMLPVHYDKRQRPLVCVEQSKFAQQCCRALR